MSGAAAVVILVGRRRLRADRRWTRRFVYVVEGLILVTAGVDVVVGLALAHALPPMVALLTQVVLPIAVTVLLRRSARQSPRQPRPLAACWKCGVNVPLAQSDTWRAATRCIRSARSTSPGCSRSARCRSCGGCSCERGSLRSRRSNGFLVGLLGASAAIQPALAIVNDHGFVLASVRVDAVLLAVVAQRVLRGSP